MREKQRIPRPNQNSRNRIVIALLGLILALSTLCYLPGRSGPFIFDDYTNLIDNSYIKITSLDPASLYYAAYSLDSGPLHRPVAMLSFALNYYFARTFVSSTAYKITNIFIHGLVALALFWLLRLMLSRLQDIGRIHLRFRFYAGPPTDLVAFAVALLWAVHPMELGGVLYVVQRMNQLSALFSLLALAFYVKGRLKTIQGDRRGLAWMIFGVVFWGTLAILSKENAALLPLFILLLELFLFSGEWPWALWDGFSKNQKYVASALVGAAAIAAFVGALLYALPGYASRDFTLWERVLTEARVLFFYLSLIIVPQINRFGHQHDDIALSTSLLHPWTTPLALAGHVVLIVTAIALRRRAVLFSLGVLWFYIGHLLESTIFPLEIAIEHRNYLPDVGVILAMVGLVIHFGKESLQPKLVWLVPIVALIFGSITVLRAYQWGSPNSFYRYEAMHHPNSARIQAGLSILLQAQHQYAGAQQALEHAYEIDPEDPGFLLQMQMLDALQKRKLDPAREALIIDQLKTKTISSTTFLTIQQICNCLQGWCQSLQVPLEVWTRAILSRKKAVGDKSYYYYALGLSLGSQDKVEEAIHYLNKSFQADPIFLHPLFALASIYIQLRMPDQAEEVLMRLRKANQGNPHPRDREIKLVATDIERLRRGESVTVPLINRVK